MGLSISVGHVVLTQDAPGLADLQRAAHQQFTPDVPLLIQDTSSPRGLPQRMGIVNGIADAARWGADRGLDWLFVHVRRYLPLWNWRNDLLATISACNPPTAGNGSPREGIPLRMDAIGIKAGTWAGAPAAFIKEHVAMQLSGANVGANGLLWWAAWAAAGRKADLRESAELPFVPLPRLVSSDRRIPPTGGRCLWHYYSPDADYSRAAQELGLENIDLTIRPCSGCR